MASGRSEPARMHRAAALARVRARRARRRLVETGDRPSASTASPRDGNRRPSLDRLVRVVDDHPLGRAVRGSTDEDPSTGAADWRRAAVVITSPATIDSPAPVASSATSASPVATRSGRGGRERRPAFNAAIESRAASGGSQPRARGRPRAQSGRRDGDDCVPDELLDRAAVALSSRRNVSWYRRSSARVSSGSSCSARAVEPTRSTNNAVTTFRLLACGVSAPSVATACVAKPRIVGVLATALGAADHASSVRRLGTVLTAADAPCSPRPRASVSRPASAPPHVSRASARPRSRARRSGVPLDGA